MLDQARYVYVKNQLPLAVTSSSLRVMGSEDNPCLLSYVDTSLSMFIPGELAIILQRSQDA